MSTTTLAWALAVLALGQPIVGFSVSKTFGDHMVLARSGAIVFGFDTPGSVVKTGLAGDSFTTTTVRSKVHGYRPWLSLSQSNTPFTCVLALERLFTGWACGFQSAVWWNATACFGFVCPCVCGPMSAFVQDSSGLWRQSLPAVAAGGPYNLTFVSSEGGSVVLTDVLFGDVYLCGGQSNMQFTVSSALNASAEIAAANYANIRVFTVGQGNSSATPLRDLASIEQVHAALVVGFRDRVFTVVDELSNCCLSPWLRRPGQQQPRTRSVAANFVTSPQCWCIDVLMCRVPCSGLCGAVCVANS